MAKFIIMSGLLEHEQALLVSYITINSPVAPYTQAKTILVEAYQTSLSANSEQAFQEMDLDKDNKITYTEFVTTCLKNNQVCSMLSSKVLDFVSSDCGSC